MNTQPDFEELLRLLEETNVAYMIVGGYAVAFYGYPRFTTDIDIFFHAETKNIQKLKAALVTFGFEESSLPDSIFIEKGTIIKFGIEPVRIDLLNEIDGLQYDDSQKRTVRGKYGTIEVTFIGKSDLIINKKASGRTQDLADLEKLEN